MGKSAPGKKRSLVSKNRWPPPALRRCRIFSLTPANRLCPIPPELGPAPDFFEGFIGYLASKAPRLLTHWMRSHSKDWTGGYREYFSISNGACFVVPGFEGKKHFQILSRGFSAEKSAGAAGSAPCCSYRNVWTWPESLRRGQQVARYIRSQMCMLLIIKRLHMVIPG